MHDIADIARAATAAIVAACREQAGDDEPVALMLAVSTPTMNTTTAIVVTDSESMTEGLAEQVLTGLAATLMADLGEHVSSVVVVEDDGNGDPFAKARAQAPVRPMPRRRRRPRMN